MYNPFSLVNKTVLVTGASSGIGKAVAIECSKMGAHVIVTGRNAQRLDETFSLLQGDRHRKITCDFSNREEVRELSGKLPLLNGLVHSAGTVRAKPFPEVTQEDMHYVFDINFFAPALLSQTLLADHKLQENGSIVFLSSIDGPVVIHPYNSIYASTKGAINALARNMAVDLAGYKIRVNCVSPGMTETPMVDGYGKVSRSEMEKQMLQYPLKRFAEAEEIAHAVIYYLSDASSFTTGTNLIVDGGFSLL